jgi:hypothetical protein
MYTNRLHEQKYPTSHACRARLHQKYTRPRPPLLLVGPSKNLTPAPIRSSHACRPKVAKVGSRIDFGTRDSRHSCHSFEPREREWRVAWRAWHGDLAPCASKHTSATPLLRSSAGGLVRLEAISRAQSTYLPCCRIWAKSHPRRLSRKA